MSDTTLRLNLKARWYDMIESGIKKEEYRSIKPYWMARLMTTEDGYKMPVSYWQTKLENCLINRLNFGDFVKFDYVEFVYGYTKRTMKFKCNGIHIGKGKPEWGAFENANYFVIEIGERQ